MIGIPLCHSAEPLIFALDSWIISLPMWLKLNYWNTHLEISSSSVLPWFISHCAAMSHSHWPQWLHPDPLTQVLGYLNAICTHSIHTYMELLSAILKSLGLPHSAAPLFHHWTWNCSCRYSLELYLTKIIGRFLDFLGKMPLVNTQVTRVSPPDEDNFRIAIRDVYLSTQGMDLLSSTVILNILITSFAYFHPCIVLSMCQTCLLSYFQASLWINLLFQELHEL